MLKHIGILLTFTLLFACKNDTNKSTTESEDPKTNVIEGSSQNLPIPNACEMLSEEWLKSNLKLNVSDLTIKDGSGDDAKDNKSCFFRWEESSEPNAGILVQIMTNPVYDEFPEWVSSFIAAKISDGEMQLGSAEPTRFKKFNVGAEGAYSYDLKRFYWRMDNNYLFMLAFNITSTESDMVDKANKIAKEVNKNFNAKMN